ncbi:hypothetical protein CO046_02410 [Candidatus Peregrinibacteria bacterium CG_4_9_14_0_2_um_filter_53_11]|nr:MAG: hypothetical protein CO046_02410 [Candidatus Peregrinibacteria bacterium CG_4_9_14_0_2_um_filter_53_11]
MALSEDSHSRPRNLNTRSRFEGRDLTPPSTLRLEQGSHRLRILLALTLTLFPSSVQSRDSRSFVACDRTTPEEARVRTIERAVDELFVEVEPRLGLLKRRNPRLHARVLAAFRAVQANPADCHHSDDSNFPAEADPAGFTFRFRSLNGIDAGFNGENRRITLNRTFDPTNLGALITLLHEGYHTVQDDEERESVNPEHYDQFWSSGGVNAVLDNEREAIEVSLEVLDAALGGALRKQNATFQEYFERLDSLPEFVSRLPNARQRELFIVHSSYYFFESPKSWAQYVAYHYGCSPLGPDGPARLYDRQLRPLRALNRHDCSEMARRLGIEE